MSAVVEPHGGAAEPDVVEPDVVEPDVVEPDVVEPDVVEPDVVEPAPAGAAVVEPAVVEPAPAGAAVEAEPGGADPVSDPHPGSDPDPAVQEPAPEAVVPGPGAPASGPGAPAPGPGTGPPPTAAPEAAATQDEPDVAEALHEGQVGPAGVSGSGGGTPTTAGQTPAPDREASPQAAAAGPTLPERRIDRQPEPEPQPAAESELAAEPDPAAEPELAAEPGKDLAGSPAVTPDRTGRPYDHHIGTNSPRAEPESAGPIEPVPEPAAAPAAAPAAPAAPAAETGRDRLRAALVPRASRGQIASGVLCALLGLALATQVQGHRQTDLASLRQSELIGLLDDTSERADRLESELLDLTRARDELLSSSDQSAAARELARERLDVLGVLAGTAPATGPGIELTITGGDVGADLLLAAVQELRDAGAEAIQLNDVRVVASTYFLDAPDAPEAADDVGAVVDVGGQLVQAPFTFSAIGSSRTLASAMEFPGGVLPTVSSRGGTASVRQLERIDVTALRPLDEPTYARSTQLPPDEQRTP